MYGDPAVNSYPMQMSDVVGNISRKVTGSGKMEVKGTRKISSTIIDVQYLGPMPSDLPTREIFVEGELQEVVTQVAKKEVVETVKHVPRVEVEYVEKLVEVPRIHWVERTVEIPEYRDLVVKVPKLEYVEKKVEVIREVKVPRIVYIEKIVEVPGPIMEVPKPVVVEERVDISSYHDHNKPVVVAQVVKPTIVEGGDVIEMEVLEYIPECKPVEISVLKGVSAKMSEGMVTDIAHRVVCVPAAQYNSLLRILNEHLPAPEIERLPYVVEQGTITFLSGGTSYSDPVPDAMIQGYDPNALPVPNTASRYTTSGYVYSPPPQLVPQDRQQQMMTTTTNMSGGAPMYSGGGGRDFSNAPRQYQAPTSTSSYTKHTSQTVGQPRTTSTYSGMRTGSTAYGTSTYGPTTTSQVVKSSSNVQYTGPTTITERQSSITHPPPSSYLNTNYSSSGYFPQQPYYNTDNTYRT